MVKEQYSDERASFTESPVSLDQVQRIVNYLGKQGLKVYDVAVDYDFIERRLTVTGLPAEGTRADAENVLGRVVEGILYIYPDDLDKSA